MVKSALMNGRWQNFPFHPDIFLNTKCFQCASAFIQPSNTTDFIVFEEIRIFFLLILHTIVERITGNKLSIPKVTRYWFRAAFTFKMVWSSGFPMQSPAFLGELACLHCNWPRCLHGNTQASPEASSSVCGPVWCSHRTDSCYSPSLQT